MLKSALKLEKILKLSHLKCSNLHLNWRKLWNLYIWNTQICTYLNPPWLEKNLENAHQNSSNMHLKLPIKPLKLVHHDQRIFWHLLFPNAQICIHICFISNRFISNQYPALKNTKQLQYWIFYYQATRFVFFYGPLRNGWSYGTQTKRTRIIKKANEGWWA